jgi:hypothetical protein
MNGLIQLVPEYSGSAPSFMSLGRLSATSNATATYRSLTRSAERRGLVAAQPAPAQDANAIVVTAFRPTSPQARCDTWMRVWNSPGWTRVASPPADCAGALCLVAGCLSWLAS